MKKTSILHVLQKWHYLSRTTTMCFIVLLGTACATQETNAEGVAIEKECRSTESSGSRLRRASVCLTKEQWASIDARAAEDAIIDQEDADQFFRRAADLGRVTGAGSR